MQIFYFVFMKKTTVITSSFIDRFDMKPKNISLSEYKDIVLRDISYLLSTTSYFTREDLIKNLGRVKLSVLAYGINSYLGDDYSAYKSSMLQHIKNAILAYEPRIRAETLELIEHGSDGINFKLLIKGQLIVPQSNESLMLTLNIDIETGHSVINKYKE